MKFRTVKTVRLELQRRGGYLETIRDTELPEYAPHLSMTEQGWPQGSWIKEELLNWASENLTHA
jgi:transposase